MSVLKGVGDHCSFLPVDHNTAVAKKCNFIMEMQSNLLHVGGGNLSLDFVLTISGFFRLLFQSTCFVE